jgi:hypothetical protein
MSGWPELGKAALDVLGKSAPWVVIGCLAAFGIYKLQELNQQNLVSVQKIAEKERTQAREDFSVANTALKDTYKAANTLYTDMMTSMGNSLKQLHSLESEVRDKQKTVYESEIAAERTKIRLETQQSELEKMQKQVDQAHSQAEAERRAVDAAKKDTAKAQVAKEAAELSAQELFRRLALQRADLEASSRQLETTKRQIDEKRSELQQAIARLKDVGGLASELAHLSDNPRTEDIIELRRKARAILPGINDFLTSYRDHPDSRNQLDMRSLVGLKVLDLKEAINAVLGFNWFVVIRQSRDSYQAKIIAISDDERLNDFIRSSIVFNISDLSREKGEALAPNASAILDQPLTVSGVQFSSAVVYRCVDPDDFNGVNTMAISETALTRNSLGMEIGAEVPIFETLDWVMSFGATVRSLKGEPWKQKVLSPADVLEFMPQTARTWMEENDYFAPVLCLRFVQNRELLARTDIKVVGLTESENEMIRAYISGLYNYVFHAKQAFIDRPDLSSVVGESNVRNVGAFISGIAQVALPKRAESGISPPVVSISVIKSGNKYTLQLVQPRVEASEKKGFDPLYLQLVDNKLGVISGIGASN